MTKLFQSEYVNILVVSILNIERGVSFVENSLEMENWNQKAWEDLILKVKMTNLSILFVGKTIRLHTP